MAHPSRYQFPVIGEPVVMSELDACEVIAGLGDFTIAANDPPWMEIAPQIPTPARLVVNRDMERATLDQIAAGEPDESDVVVGIGGGTAIDTAKYIAWKCGKRLVLVPSILSVDAAFTSSVGVREQGRVRYVGDVRPELVVLDIPLIQGAPPRLNRAGVGDIVSCHTGMWDWNAAVARGISAHPWRDDLANFAHTLLEELDAATAEVNAVSSDGVRFLATATRAIGAACVQANHARFEEGSEHFFAYNYEHATGVHQVHGELVALGVVALSVVQGNRTPWVASIVQRCGVCAHPSGLGITESQFRAALLTLRDYARREELWFGVADFVDITDAMVDDAWSVVNLLPRAP